MDPIAIANSAIGVLQKVKQALDECKEAFEEAKELRKAVDLFEVTIMMIPNKAQPAAPKAAPTPLAEVGRVGTVLTVARDAAMERASEVISGSPFGVVLDMFKLSPTGEPIFGGGPSPSEVLQDMKNTKIDDIRVYSDLEVMFAGMAFIIKSALESMSDATETLQQMNTIGEPSYLWLCQPWKIAQMKGVKENLAGHFDSLAKQTVALQSAIGVASYAVQLEQLENTLDATSVLTNLDMRDLWKKKLGIDRTRVPFSEFCDAFLSSVRVKVKEARAAYIVEEKVGRFRAPCDVVLGRFLNELYNEDNDDYISAFELSHALDAFVPRGHKSVPHTTDHLLRKEVEFLNFIKFRTIALPDSLLRASRFDPLSGLVDNTGVVPERTVYPYGERADGVILVRPFHRLLLRADVPVMDDETFPYDHLIMLKYRWNPLLKPSAVQDEEDTDEVSEVKHSKTYVHLSTNELMLGRRDTSWNAFRSFVRVEGGNAGVGVVGGEGGKGGEKGGKDGGEGGNEGGEEGEKQGREGGEGGKGGESVKQEEKEGKEGKEGEEGVNKRSEGGAPLVKKSVVPPGFSESSNFEELDREELMSVGTAGMGEKGVSAKFKPDPFVTPTRILYVPYLLEPGYYSPRFCVDAYDGDARNKQKMAKSAKSYYRSFATPLPYCATTDEVRKEVKEVAAEQKGDEGGEGGDVGGFGSGNDEANFITAREAAYNEQIRIAAYNSKLGVLVKCLDVLELVFAEDIALESQFHEDGDDSDNDNDNDNADIVQKTGFRPQLSRYYPYLPDRELESYAPMDVEVYVNVPSRRGASASDLTFIPTKIALFLCPEEKLMENSVKAVTSRTKRYKYSKSLLKEVVGGLFGGDTGITAISFLIGFVDESGKNRLANSPAVTLAFDERAEEEGEEEYVGEVEEGGGNEDEGEETPIFRNSILKATIGPTSTSFSPRASSITTSNNNAGSAVSPGSRGLNSGSTKGAAVSFPRSAVFTPSHVSTTTHTTTGHTTTGHATTHTTTHTTGTGHGAGSGSGSVKVSSPRAVASPPHSSGSGGGSSGGSGGGGVSGGSSKHNTASATVTGASISGNASPRISTDPPFTSSSTAATTGTTGTAGTTTATTTIAGTSATAGTAGTAATGPSRAPSFRVSTGPSAPRTMAPPSRPGSVKTTTNNNTTTSAKTSNTSNISNTTLTSASAQFSAANSTFSTTRSSPKAVEKNSNSASVNNTATTSTSTAASVDTEGEELVEKEVSVKKRVQKIEVVRSSGGSVGGAGTSPQK